VLSSVKLNQKTLTIWKICLLQYMIINPLLTLIAIPLYIYTIADVSLAKSVLRFDGRRDAAPSAPQPLPTRHAASRCAWHRHHQHGARGPVRPRARRR
jgi:hypothetical protein